MDVSLPLSSIVIIAAGSIGAVTAILSGIIYISRRQTLNRSDIFLALLLILSGLTLLNECLAVSGMANRFRDLYFIPIFYSLSIAPLFYLFVRTKYFRSLSKLDYVHLILPVFQALVYWSIGLRSIAFKSYLWELEIFRLYLTVETILFPVSLVFYSILSLSILKKSSGPDHFWREDLRKWLVDLTRVFVVVAVAEFTIAIGEHFFGYRFGPVFISLRVIFFMGFLLWISFNAIRLIFTSPVYISKPRDQKIKVDHDVLLTTKDILISLMEDSKVYLNPDLSIRLLSEYAGVTEKQCSHILSTGLNMNFNQFINGFRIQHFQELVHAGRHNDHTLLSLAYESGFDSKSTFNRSFKKLTSMTPSQYVKSIKNSS